MSDDSLPSKVRRMSEPGCTGLKNLGLTCFMNVVLQVFSNTYCIKQFFDNNCLTSPIPKNSISYVVRDTICKLWSGRHMYFSPKVLVSTIISKMPQFEGEENDCHEFFLSLTSELHDELKHPPKEHDVYELETSIFRKTFYGLQNIVIKCSNCSYETRKNEIFNHLSLALPIRNTRLKNVLQSYFKSENLNDFKCPICNSVDTCTRTVRVTKTPNVLVLCLKRLISEIIDGECIMTKNRVKIRYPIKNLQFAGKTYNLYAVILHTAEEDYDEYGHYYNYCKNHRSGLWLQFNDNDVCEIDDDEILDAKRSFMLFYEQASKKQ